MITATHIPRFIIVDDDSSNNFLCECAIRVMFPESIVDSFENPVVALNAINDKYGRSENDERIVLFLDINMPYLSGWDFLENFKKIRGQLRGHFEIYMLSSSINMSDKERVEADSDIVGFLSKPLIVRELRLLLSGQTH
jgi:CheY-like chemotaxis protein